MNRRRWLFLLQSIVTAILLGLLVRRFDWPTFRRLLHDIPWRFYGFSFAAVLASQLLSAWRWHTIMRALAVPVSFIAACEQSLVGIFLSNFLPSTIGGDSAKVYYLGRDSGYVRIAASVLADRLIAAFVLAALGALLTWHVAAPPAAMGIANAVVGLIWIALATVLLLATFAPPELAWLTRMVRRWPRLEFQVTGARRLATDLQSVLRQPWVWLRTGLMALAGYLLVAFIYREFITLTAGGRPDLRLVLGVVALLGTLSSVPIAVNGLGLREQLHVALLGMFALGPEAAAGISLLMLAHLLVISAWGSILWLRMPMARSGA